ncbi:MAG: DUF86 domain-containing protein [Desulfobacteraceae bacterium]|nr:DUF86 domain-containing protein [Desulfobacteraceae bacterium]
MKRDPKVYLHDIQEAGGHIREFTKGMSMEDYPALLERISDTEKIIGFRNVLVHGYDIIDDATVWSAIKTNLPTLLEEVRTLQNA